MNFNSRKKKSNYHQPNSRDPDDDASQQSHVQTLLSDHSNLSIAAPGKGDGAKDAQDLRVSSKKDGGRKGSKKESKGKASNASTLTKQPNDKLQGHQSTADAPPNTRLSIPEGGQHESDPKQRKKKRDKHSRKRSGAEELCGPFQMVDNKFEEEKHEDDQRGKNQSKSKSKSQRGQRHKQGDNNAIAGEMKMPQLHDLKKVQELKTTELDASKSDLRASVNSSNLDLSSNHPEFKKRISRDTSIERQDKSKALFGQIGLISTLSHKKILEASSKSGSFLTEQNCENKSVSYMNSSVIDQKQMNSQRDKRSKSKFMKDKPNLQIDVQQLNSEGSDQNEQLRQNKSRSAAPQQLGQERERATDQVNKESIGEINLVLDKVQQIRDEQNNSQDEYQQQQQKQSAKTINNHLSNPNKASDLQKTDHLEGMTNNNSNRQYNNSNSAKQQSGYFNSQYQDKDDNNHQQRSKRSKNSRRGDQYGSNPMIVFPKPVFKYLKKAAYHQNESESMELLLNDSMSAKLINQQPQDISMETTARLDQIKFELNPFIEPHMAKKVTKTNDHYRKYMEHVEQFQIVLDGQTRNEAMSRMASDPTTLISVSPPIDEGSPAGNQSSRIEDPEEGSEERDEDEEQEDDEDGNASSRSGSSQPLTDGDEEEGDPDEEEEDEDDEDEDDEDEDDEDEDDDEDNEDEKLLESERSDKSNKLGDLVEKKVEYDKELERLVMVKQQIVNGPNGKQLRHLKVIELASGKIIEDTETEVSKDQSDEDYELKLDKETWQYFKQMAQSIDMRRHKTVKMDHNTNPIMSFCKGLGEIFQQMFKKDQTFMISQNDPRKTQWELFVIVLALYNAFSIPFELSFDPVIMQGVNFLILNTLIDIIFAFDIFIQFRTTFYHPITGDEIKDLKIIKNNYMRGRFSIDFLSTVPFDNILYLFTQSENQILALFSLLKIFRVNRLGRIIARLNVSEDTKNSLKLFQLVFFIVMYIHCSGCAWFSIVNHDETWIAPLDIGSDDEYLYDDDILRKYFISIYHSVLLMTGNDAFPVGDLQVFFVVFSNTVGAIINANILGNMAVLIQDLNRKTDAFQKKLDKVNTAMQNIRLDTPLQSRVVGFLQYTQQSQENQKELTLFIQNISPSLKHQVIEFIFQNVIEANDMFKNDKQLVNILFSKMELQMYDPEDIVIRQSERAEKLYFISKGECEVSVNDENRDEAFVQIMGPGTYFGEIALISSNNRRTATVKTKSYSNIGHITQETFNEIITIFPDVKNAMKQNFIQYQDRFRCWQKMMLLNIDYFRDLSIETYEELIFVLRNEVFQTGSNIFIQNKYYNKVHILINGEIEMFFSLKNKEPIKVESCDTRGQVFNSISCLTMDKIIYSARAVSSVTMMTIGLSDLQDIMLRRKDLKKRIEHVVNSNKDPEQKPMLDYSRTNFQQAIEDQKIAKLQAAPTTRVKGETTISRKFVTTVERCLAYQRYQRQKEGKIQELIRQLRRQNSGLIKKEARKTEQVIEQQTPIMKKKIQQLVIKQINQLHVSTEQQQDRLRSIQELIKEIRTEKTKPATNKIIGGKKNKKSKKKDRH